jgi:hypothetical protein
MQTTTRKSVPLTVDLTSLTDAMQISGSPERLAVESMVGPLPDRLSQAAALSILLSYAHDRVQEAMLTTAYAHYASQLDDEDASYATAVKQRRTQREAKRGD